MSQSTYVTLTVAVVTYSTALLNIRSGEEPKPQLRPIIKSISAGHSIISTITTLVALSQSWKFPTSRALSEHQNLAVSNVKLDDSENPLIAASNTLAKHLTAWEAGYLIYDIGALVLDSYDNHKRSDGPIKPLVVLLRKSPLTLIHHISLAGALCYLQTYISDNREKGLKIITAFLLMNASTPLVHLRWWRKKHTGHRSATIDGAVAVTFFLSRLGTIYWILKAYGQHHDLSALAALHRQRWQCQTGTGMLVGLNLLWWLGFVRQITMQKKVKST